MDKLLKLLKAETKRQNDGLELIASENFTSKKVRALAGSILTNKYAEGYPGRRYYGGCRYIDEIEQTAIDLVTELFGAKFANVQPHSGSSANMIAYASVLEMGDKILTLSLNEGGHLTHGSPVNFSSKHYEVTHYHLLDDGRIDYDGLQELAKSLQPKLILAGFSAYPFAIDFKRIGEIAKKHQCLLYGRYGAYCRLNRGKKGIQIRFHTLILLLPLLTKHYVDHVAESF